jgi:hypothetical protein
MLSCVGTPVNNKPHFDKEISGMKEGRGIYYKLSARFDARGSTCLIR